jgi:hypothetical protein
MPSLRRLFRHLWRWNAQRTADPSPVDAIVRLLRNANGSSSSDKVRNDD